jgi:hypothetical protein
MSERGERVRGVRGVRGVREVLNVSQLLDPSERPAAEDPIRVFAAATPPVTPRVFAAAYCDGLGLGGGAR